MGRSQWMWIARGVCLAILALVWVFFAPVQLGGSTLYSSTAGTSMEPLLHDGDLAIVRRATSYQVGDIVLYESAVLHRPVLHRIIVIQNGHYFFKGDNNDFVDPGYATRSELLGKFWFRIQHGGAVLGWFGRPLHASLVAGFATAFLLFGAGSGKTRKRRLKLVHVHSPAVSARRLTMLGVKLHRPRKSGVNIGASAAFVLALVLLGVGYSTPTTRTEPVTGFHQAGTFAYSAKPLRASSAYPTGVAHIGQPLFLNDFNLINLDFSYRFESKLVEHVHGTVTLKALIASDTGWQNLYTLEKKTSFSGTTATSGGTFSLQQLQTLLASLSREAGTVGTDYSIELRPVVHVTGTFAGTTIKASFSPLLPMTVNQTLLTVNVAQPVTAPGATYALTSAASALNATVHPTQPGSVPGTVANFLSLARYHLGVTFVREAGFVLAALGFLALVSNVFMPSRERWSNEKRIAHRRGCVIVDVASFADSSSPLRPSTEVPVFDDLVTLAAYCERPILRETRGQRPAYAVDDDGRLYIHRPVTESPAVARLAQAGTS